MSKNFLVGQVVRLPIRCIDPLTGTGVDPGGVILRIRPPGRALTDYTFGQTPEIVKDAVGRYHALIVADVAGEWRYRWELAAPHVGTEEGSFTVDPSKVLG